MVLLAAMARSIFKLAQGMVGWWVFLGVRLLSHRRQGAPPSLLVDIVERWDLGVAWVGGEGGGGQQWHHRRQWHGRSLSWLGEWWVSGFF